MTIENVFSSQTSPKIFYKDNHCYINQINSPHYGRAIYRLNFKRWNQMPQLICENKDMKFKTCLKSHYVIQHNLNIHEQETEVI